jgi:biotin carboxylase
MQSGTSEGSPRGGERLSAAGSSAYERPPRVLILDRRAVMATEMCRIMAQLGCEVDVFGEPFSPAFRSRFVKRCLVSPGTQVPDAFRRAVEAIVARGAYDAIFVCNEEVLESVLDLPSAGQCRGLVLSAPDRLRLALSRKAMSRVAETAGVAVPRTIVPDKDDLLGAARELGFPLIVKGDRGEAGNHVRLVRDPGGLRAAYDEIASLERAYGEPPVLQEYVRGKAYSVGGLFDNGRPLRICAHLKLAGVPPLGGLTAKGVTVRVPELLDAAFKVFAVLQYRGLGHCEFIQDSAGRFRFLEVNPRVWGTVAVSWYAGVDLFSAYLRMAAGMPVSPDLSYREGVRFHRVLREIRLLQRRPTSIGRVLKDCLDPGVCSDFQWSDCGPHLNAFSLRARGWLERWRKAPLSRTMRASVD